MQVGTASGAGQASREAPLAAHLQPRSSHIHPAICCRVAPGLSKLSMAAQLLATRWAPAQPSRGAGRSRRLPAVVLAAQQQQQDRQPVQRRELLLGAAAAAAAALGALRPQPAAAADGLVPKGAGLARGGVRENGMRVAGQPKASRCAQAACRREPPRHRRCCAPACPTAQPTRRRPPSWWRRCARPSAPTCRTQRSGRRAPSPWGGRGRAEERRGRCSWRRTRAPSRPLSSPPRPLPTHPLHAARCAAPPTPPSRWCASS